MLYARFVLEREQLDVVVVGAGVVGLAIARAVARSGRAVHVLEAEPRLGVHTSSRNSEVIHAGIYYSTGSRKAELAVRGRKALYAFCERAAVPHRRLGKLIVATDPAELPLLEAYLLRGRANGVDDLSLLTAAEAHKLEPEVRCVGALFSPSTGIVDSHELMRALKREAEANGAMVVVRSPLLRASVVPGGFELCVGEESFRVRARSLVNCAGLFAQQLARRIDGLDSTTIPPPYYARGQYYYLRGVSPFRRLIYPLPNADGLGVHVTLDLAGRARFGPDVTFIEDVDYTFDPSRTAAFESAIRRYYPNLPDDALLAGYTGIRPKLGPEGTTSDFVLQDARAHGCEGLVNLYGIESPGLTAALTIADEVASLLGRRHA